MTSDSSSLALDVAIIGRACRFPGARSPEEYWDNLASGRESIVPLDEATLLASGVPLEEIRSRHYVKVHAPIPDLKAFDAAFFGFSPREAAILDPQHRHLLEVAWAAFEDAGCVPSRIDRPVGVFVGSGHHHYFSQHLLTRDELLRDVGFFLLRHTGNDKDFLATRLSYLLNLRGPSIAVQTACSTSLVAVHLAVQSLLNGECHMAVAGGVTIELPADRGYRYAEGEILSPDGRCRPFEAASQGTVFGSGCGVILLKQLAHALEDGDPIHAVIRATAVNNDGTQKVGYLAPSVDGHAQVAREALDLAGIDPRTVSYIEAHGTGTPVGDPIEVAALTEAYGARAAGMPAIGLGSVKGNIGHLDTAAGIASLIKVVESLKHRRLPPTLHFVTPNPACRFERSRLEVVAAAREWRAEIPRRAGVSALGVGGTNAHVLLEEAPPVPAARHSAAPQLLVVSARSSTALRGNLENLAAAVTKDAPPVLGDVSWTLQVGRESMPHRAAVVAATAEEAALALRAAVGARGQLPAPRGAPVTFLFAGGGAQHAAMGAELYATYPAFRAVVDAGLRELQATFDIDLAPLLLPPAEADLALLGSALEQPSRSLPALFIVQTATAALLRSWGVQPTAVLGHSMGEYSAAHVAGVLSFSDALRLVVRRGQLFERVPAGAMLSIAAPVRDIEPRLPPSLSIAAVNAPGLCVASGPTDAIEALQRELEADAIDCARVRIRVAAHSAMLEGILDEWREVVESVRFAAPQLPVISNLHGRALTADEAADPTYWVRQLRETVRFSEGAEDRLAAEAGVFVECGPGRVLTTLVRQHPNRSARHVLVPTLGSPKDGKPERIAILESAGAIWEAGIALDWEQLRIGQPAARRVSLPTYAFDRTEHWIEPASSASSRAQSAEAARPRRREDPGDWFHEEGWRREPLVDAGTLPTQVLVLGGSRALRRQLATAFGELGCELTWLDVGWQLRERAPGHFEIDHASPEAYRDLFRELGQSQRLPDLVIHAWQLDEKRFNPSPYRAGLHAVDAVGSLVWLAQAIAGAQGPSNCRLLVLTLRAHSVSGEPVSHPFGAMSAATCAVLNVEADGLQCTALDLETLVDGGALSAPDLEAVVQESLLRPDAAARVCLRGGRRWVPELVPVPPPSPPLAPSASGPGATYLITGGVGGIALAIAEHLLRVHRANVALLVRTPLPPRSEWDALLADPTTDRRLQGQLRAIRTLEATGQPFRIVVADVADRAQLATAVSEAEQTIGRITTVLHTAGTLDDSLFVQKTPASLDRVLRPKVQGTLALHDVFRGRGLEQLVLFSSTSVLHGLPGQADYAAANAFLDAFARWRSANGGLRTVAINWSAWLEVGMAARAAAAQGVDLSGITIGRVPKRAHHLLTHVTSDTADAFEMRGRLDASGLWTLDEHRLRDGTAVLPGSGYVDLVVAALWERGEMRPVCLSDVQFVSPLVVEDDAVIDLRVSLTRTADDGFTFGVESREATGLSDWALHCLGTVDAASSAPPAATALGADPAGEPVPVGHAKDSPNVAFGPRWWVLESARRIGPHEASLALALDAPFVRDLQEVALHPALLDVATAGAQFLMPGFDEATHFFVPMSYGRCQVHAPLPSRVESHVTLRSADLQDGGTAVFDIVVRDPSGAVLLEATEFTMFRPSVNSALGSKRPDRGVTASRSESDGRSLRDVLSAGIPPAEGLAVLDRLLASHGTSVVAVLPAGPEVLDRGRHLTEAAPSAWEGDAEREALEVVPPRTDMERAVHGIAAELLGTSRLSVTDELADRGLHSLLAVRLFNRLQRATGRNLPLSALLEAPTIELLARRLGGADPSVVEGGEGARSAVRPVPSSASGASESEPEVRGVYDGIELPDSMAYILPPEIGPEEFSSLVPLKPSGTRTPFFVIHARGGAVLNYQRITKFVERDRPVYGLQSVGLDGITPPLRSIEEMARHYVEVIRGVQPHGPYLLGGGSLGGVIAVEMALILAEHGERTELIAMFDSWGPDVFADAVRPTAIADAGGKFQRVAQLLREQGLRRTARFVRYRGGERVHELFRSGVLRWHLFRQRTQRVPLPHATRYEYVERTNLAALRVYRPRPYNGDVLLFRAVDDPDFDPRDPTMGWSRTVRGTMRTIDCPGTHNTIMKGPVFGEYLKRELEAADQRIAARRALRSAPSTAGVA